MRTTTTTLPGVLILEPNVFGDARGFFMETWHAERYAELGIAGPFVQDNLSSSTKGVLRGLHYQHPHAQGKLVSVVQGEVFDVAVDIRRSSQSFGQWVGAELSDENQAMLFVPPGFAHGFVVLSDVADFCYKCTTLWHQQSDRSLLWSDPAIGIDWPLDGLTPQLAGKDAAAPLLADAEVFA